LQPPDLLEQLSLLGLTLLLGLGVLAPAEQLAGSVQQLPLPLAHLDRVDGLVGGNLLDCLAATDRLHGDPGFELGAVGAAFAHRWEPFQGRYPASKETMGPVQKNQSTSVAGQPLAGTAQGDPRFCRQFCQRAVVEKVLIDEPEPALLRQTGIGMAMHGALGLGWWFAPQPVATSHSLVS